MGKALLICFGMFTKLPVPIVEWEEKKGAAALSFFPFVGLVCGLVTYFVAFLTRLVSLSETLSAMFILFSLFLIAGFVHLDGFMDTADAFLSARDRERKIAILKDSKVGAFSVIAIALVLLTLYVSLRSLLLERVDLLFFLFVPMLSRAYAASALFTLKPLQNKGILAYFRDGKTGVHIAVSVIIGALILGALAWMGLLYLLSAGFAVLIVFLFDLYAQHSLGGINGDIIGASIVLSETFSYFLLATLLNILA